MVSSASICRPLTRFMPNSSGKTVRTSSRLILPLPLLGHLHGQSQPAAPDSNELEHQSLRQVNIYLYLQGHPPGFGRAAVCARILAGGSGTSADKTRKRLARTA